MMKNNYLIIAAIAIIVILQAVTLMVAFGGEKRLGGTTADDWNVGGALAVTGNSTLSGTLAVTGASSLTGDVGIATSTPASELDVYDATATSSIAIYSGAAAKGGWLILENTAGTACVAIGINAAGGFVTSTVTCGSSQ